jgi:hypothetical protein
MICPRCHQPFTTFPGLSRYDNTTPLCTPCETKEAMEDAGLAPPYDGPVYWQEVKP